MDIVQFRAFIFQRQFDPNRSSEEAAKIEQEVTDAFLDMTVNNEEEEKEALELLKEFCPAVYEPIEIINSQ